MGRACAASSVSIAFNVALRRDLSDLTYELNLFYSRREWAQIHLNPPKLTELQAN